MRLRKPAHAFFLAALIGAMAMGACSLNPQPIPPGEQVSADGGTNDFGGGGDASLGSSTDSGTGAVPPEGGDAGDAAVDGGDLDASDADTDANDE